MKISKCDRKQKEIQKSYKNIQEIMVEKKMHKFWRKKKVLNETPSHQTQNTFIKLSFDDAVVLVEASCLSCRCPRIILFHFLVPA